VVSGVDDFLPSTRRNGSCAGSWSTQEIGCPADPNLQSLDEVKDYYIHAVDGDIGHVNDFLLDDDDWSIRYMVVGTRNWWPRHAGSATFRGRGARSRLASRVPRYGPDADGGPGV
jgi:hypothetical protein